MPLTLEICVDTIADTKAAIAGGADRIELCAALCEGGLTPSVGLMRAAQALGTPIAAMIRPRGGDFRYSTEEIAIMQADIEAARALGIEAVVFGALDGEGALDLPALRTLVEAAGPMSCTLHRAFDFAADPYTALEQAIELGFDRILTSGQQPKAPEGLSLIAELAERAADRIAIMPGSGVTPANAALFAGLGTIREIHASCSRTVDGGADAMQIGRSEDAPRRRTDKGMVHALRAVLDESAG